MSLARILTIFRKDIRDAIRDARVLMAIIVPFGLGIFYNVVMDEDDAQPQVTIAWSGDPATRLPESLVAMTESVVEARLTRVENETAVREMLAGNDADIGLIVPTGFDQQVRAGQQPQLIVLLPDSPSVGSEYVIAALEPVLRGLAGQQPPASIEVQPISSNDAGDIFERVGLRTYFVLASIIILVGMIAMLAVPVVLADEAENHTLDALVLVASYPEVVVAKALFGVTYIVVGVSLMLAVTGILPENLALFAGGIGLFGIALIGFGLLLGGIFNATQLNTWGGLLLIPILYPAFATGLPVPRPLEIVTLLLPTSHASRIALNSLSTEAVFNNTALSFLALGIWAVAGYGLLLWRLAHREA